METTASMDSKASPEIAEQRPAPLSNWLVALPNNALALLPLVMVAPLDPKETTVALEMPDPLAPMANQETKDHAAHPAQLALPETLVPQARKVMLAKPLAPNLAHPARLEPTANPAPPALLARTAMPARMVDPAVLAALEMLVPLAPLANLAAPAAPASPAKMVPPAAANTAHQLVWLQVIKSRLQAFNGNVEHRDQDRSDTSSDSGNNQTSLLCLHCHNSFAFTMPILVVAFLTELRKKC